jgi:hypothetical protein
MAAWKIRRGSISALVAISCSVGIPIVLGVLFTSLFPWSPLGPEELLEWVWDTFSGTNAAHLPWTVSAWLAGLALGVGVRFALERKEKRR